MDIDYVFPVSGDFGRESSTNEINALDALQLLWESRWTGVSLTLWCRINMSDAYATWDNRDMQPPTGNYTLKSIESADLDTSYPTFCHFNCAEWTNTSNGRPGAEFWVYSSAGTSTSYFYTADMTSTATSTTRATDSATTTNSSTPTDGSTPSTASVTPAANESSSGFSAGTAAGIGVSVAIGILLCVAMTVFLVIRKRRKLRQPPAELAAHQMPLNGKLVNDITHEVRGDNPIVEMDSIGRVDRRATHELE